MTSKKGPRKDKLDEIRARKMAELQAQQHKSMTENFDRELKTSDKLWNGVIHGIISMLDAIVSRPDDEGNMFLTRDSELFSTGYQMLGQSAQLMGIHQPVQFGELDTLIADDLVPQLEILNASFNA